MSSFALSKESFNICSISESEIPNVGFTSTSVTLFVEVSLALTFKIPSASIWNSRFILADPANIGGISLTVNFASDLQSLAKSLSPCTT